MKVVKNILYIPFWLISPFTQIHSFKNPIIGNRLLNILGLHVSRVIIAHAITHFKFALLSFLASKEDRAEFHKNGYLLKENFLSEDLLAEIDEQARNNQHGLRDLVQGNTITRRCFVDSNTEEKLPALRKLREDKFFHNLLRYTSAKNDHPRTYTELVINREGNDPQKVLHRDCFYPTMKAWLFLDDVTEENGPFNFVPKSHKLTWRRIKWEYMTSITKLNAKGQYSKQGSFRIEEDELSELYSDPPKAFAVKRNSLVLANTFGFHYRGQAQQDSSRLSIWVSSRPNPFNPFPGFNSKALREIRDRLHRRKFNSLYKLPKK